MTLYVRTGRRSTSSGWNYGEASRVDRLREDGWTECACDGCPDSAHGLVPPDGMVEAAAEAIWHRRHDVPYRPGRPRHNKYHDDYLRDARAALVAAARWEAPE